MNRMLRRRLVKLAERTQDNALRGRLMHFTDVLVPDGCAFKLAVALSGMYRGTGTDAELKLHAVHSVRAGGAVSVEVSTGSVHDSDGFWPACWQKDALYLWDLRYENKERFLDAALADGLGEGPRRSAQAWSVSGMQSGDENQQLGVPAPQLQRHGEEGPHARRGGQGRRRLVRRGCRACVAPHTSSGTPTTP
jgi:hypothetical protein